MIEKISSFTEVDNKRRPRQKEKIILFDTGVRNVLLGRHRGRTSNEDRGLLFEQWLILQVIYLNRTFHSNWKISTYRDASGLEVDLIIEQPERTLWVEIKSGTRVSEKSFKNLRRFSKISLEAGDPIVVYCDEHAQQFADGALALPYQRFLNDLLPSQ